MDITYFITWFFNECLKIVTFVFNTLDSITFFGFSLLDYLLAFVILPVGVSIFISVIKSRSYREMVPNSIKESRHEKD